ncbi:MAG: hypothetical protein K0Q59_1622 [Paenibacillus sp.]|jgi:predicted dehydrogenase|nr:hypothetical protein [Paenibacillus sp.]
MTKIGIIGCGLLGIHHARILQQFEGVQIAALHNRSREKADRLAAEVGGTVYESYEELLQQDLDAVYVATPDHLHVDISKAVLDAGKHLFLEKTIATSVADGAEIVAAGDKHPELVAMVGYPMRFRPQHVKMKQILSSEAAGSAVQCWSMRTHFLHPDQVNYDKSRNEFYKMPDWYHKGEQAVGPIYSHGSHDYHLLQWFFGEVESVFVYGGTYLYPSTSSIADAFTVSLRFKNGAIGQVSTPWATRVAYNYIGAATENVTVVNNNGDLLVKDDHGPEQKITFQESGTPTFWLDMHKQFLDCVRNKRQAPVTLRDGLKAIAVSEAAVRSLKERREVFVEQV